MSDFRTFMGMVENAFDQKAYAVLTFTDLFEVITLEELKKRQDLPDKLLDIRVFDEKQEMHLYRDYIGSEFNVPVVISDENMDTDFYDDEQYLDVDMKRTRQNTGVVKATGGGEYRFPHRVTKDTKITLRNYICYDNDGQAYIAAWRLTGFANTGEK